MSAINYDQVCDLLTEAGLLIEGELRIDTPKIVRTRLVDKPRAKFPGYYRLWEAPLREGGTCLLGVYGFWDGASYVADETFQTGNLALPATNNALSSWGGIIPFPVPVVIPAGEKVKLKFNCVSRSSGLVDLNTYYFMQNFTQVAP
jgi:hypothetical protein